MKNSKEVHKVDLHPRLSDNKLDKQVNEMRFKQNVDRALARAKLAQEKRQNNATKK